MIPRSPRTLTFRLLNVGIVNHVARHVPYHNLQHTCIVVIAVTVVAALKYIMQALVTIAIVIILHLLSVMCETLSVKRARVPNPSFANACQAGEHGLEKCFRCAT